MPNFASFNRKQYLFALLLVCSVMCYVYTIMMSPEGLDWSITYRRDRDEQTSLWNFRDIGDQQLYLYESVLQNKWRSNVTKRDNMRQELANFRSELSGSWLVVLHQENITEEEGAKFVFNHKFNGISPELFKQLPKINPLSHGKRYRSCAVVGNSGTMLHSGCGKEIDKHDYVFRCNIPPLVPFERDAGTKSNFTTMNPSILNKRYQSLKVDEQIDQFNDFMSQFNGVILSVCHGFAIPISTIMRAMGNLKREQLKIVCANPMHVQSVAEFWLERNIRARLSTGFYMVTTAIQLCDEVELYGFWPFSERFGENKTSVPYHYFDESSCKTSNRVHTMDKEFAILVQLHNLGIIRINMASCS
ncbi:sia-alpha-2,3-Gal-beta-1,4-GlcNAc-R:alpha 2,8-sialyltransferase [Strongylocentrotus purpuratus]|uniref:Uncharacterized protein n=1 Tax=Strongylocentrotus purpuratus TaxID=7668 RepID=A0A7M7N8U1_STRPU|nr:sia-alpha-2,3-Gal-beta-1,4-GlcNAc-R:alpha 2,8-sialyltransferase [Strongylocentrotus purpuratus]